MTPQEKRKVLLSATLVKYLEKLRILHELCQGLEVSITEFFNDPIFEEDNLEP